MKKIALFLALLVGSVGCSAQSFNFSSASPTAPAGSTNIVWQHDTSNPVNVSGYITLSNLFSALGCTSAAPIYSVFANACVAPTTAVWGNISGSLASQPDLQTALDSKASATSGVTINSTFCGLGTSCAPVMGGTTPRGVYNSSTSYVTNDVVTDSGSAWICITGCTGVTPVSGSNWLLYSPSTGVTSTQTSSVIAKVTSGKNLFDYTAATQSTFLKGTDCTTQAGGSFYVSDFIPVDAGANVIANVIMGGATAGYCFYDISKTRIAGVNGAISARTTLAVPATAFWFRYTGPQASLATSMLAMGSLPTTLMPFTFSGMMSGPQTALLASKMPVGVNLINSNTATQNTYVKGTDGTTASNTNYFASDYILVSAGATLRANVITGATTAGYAFYDRDLAYVSGSNGALSANTVITVPTDNRTVFIRITGPQASLATSMLVSGSSLPSSFVPFSFLGPTRTQLLTLLSHLPTGQNLFNSAAPGLLSGSYLDGTTGIPHANVLYYVSDLIPVIPGSTVVAMTRIGAPTAGWACYGLDGTTYDSGANGTVNAGTPITLSSTCFYLKFTDLVSDLSSQMLVSGSTLPTKYSPFIWAAGNADLATSGKNIAYHGDSITALHYCTDGWCTTIESRLGLVDVMKDARPGRLTKQMFELYGGFDAYPTLDGTLSSCSVTSNVITVNGTFPQAYPAGTKVRFTGVYGNCSIIAPLMLTVASGATTSSFTASATYGGAAWTYADTATAFDTGNVLPILANGTVSSFSITSNVLTVVGTFPAYPTGALVGFSGLTTGTYLVANSTTAIQCTVNSGATTTTFTASCVANAVAWTHADVGTTTDAGTVISPGHNLGCIYFSSISKECTFGGTAGNTFDQDLRAANPDVYLVFLGTNDLTTATGTSSDVAGANTEYGAIKAGIESVLSAKPGIHLMWVTPYLKDHSGIVTVIKTAAAQYGIPVLDTMTNTTMDSPFTWTTMLNYPTDHVHPSVYGSNYLGGIIAEFIHNNF